jgi:hypothetical protein
MKSNAMPKLVSTSSAGGLEESNPGLDGAHRKANCERITTGDALGTHALCLFCYTKGEYASCPGGSQVAAQEG